MARLVSAASDTDMAYAAERLRTGHLVGFPTETVYGLGANALDDAAARKVFHVKGRPATDPLIVHVVDYEHAFQTLWNADAAAVETARTIARALWPGPLTLVATAAPCVPVSVTGGSGFVGLRVPDHPVAQRLIRESGCPIAAPSANRFGHVSPTTAQHVMDDLAARDDELTVIDGGECSIGIESTVIKVVSGTKLEVIRRGKCSANDVLEALVAAGRRDVEVVVRDTRSKYLKHDTAEAMDAPGQLLTHYAPHVPTYLLTPASLKSLLMTVPASAAAPPAWELVLPGTGKDHPTTTVPADKVLVIDFANLLSQHIRGATTLATMSLSATGDELEACRAVFNALRWSETVPGAAALCVPMITEFFATQEEAEKAGSAHPSATGTPEPQAVTVGQSSASGVSLLEAVEDRLFRAASGRIATLRPVAR